MSDPHGSEPHRSDDGERDAEHEHEHGAGVAEYVRLALMAMVIVISLTGCRAGSSVKKDCLPRDPASGRIGYAFSEPVVPKVTTACFAQ